MEYKQICVLILQHEIKKELQVDIDLQRLFFRGKQLENGYKLYDYNINLNDVIQLMAQTKIDNTEEKATSSNNVKKKRLSENKVEEELVEKELLEAESLYYKINDAVDCHDQVHGAWFEAIVQKILKNKEQILYNVCCEFDELLAPYNVSEEFIRPRARRVITSDELCVGQKVMINYNVDEPKNVGLWYDFTVSEIYRKRRSYELSGMLHMSGYIYTYTYISSILLFISLCHFKCLFVPGMHVLHFFFFFFFYTEIAIDMHNFSLIIYFHWFFL